MDSHGSVSPMRTPPTAGVDATSRSADGDVTRRRQADQAALPVQRRPSHPETAEGARLDAMDDHTTQCAICGEVVRGMPTAKGKVYLSVQADPRVDRVACTRAEPPGGRHLPQVEHAAL